MWRKWAAEHPAFAERPKSVSLAQSQIARFSDQDLSGPHGVKGILTSHRGDT